MKNLHHEISSNWLCLLTELQPQLRCNSHQHFLKYALLCLHHYHYLLQLLNHLEKYFRNHYLDHKLTRMSFDWAITTFLVSPSLKRPNHDWPLPEGFHVRRRRAAYPPSQTACRPRARNFRVTIHIPTSLQHYSCCCLMFLLPFMPLLVTLCRQNLIVKKRTLNQILKMYLSIYF